MSTPTENPVPNGMPTFEGCPHWGKGGQYIYDPVTQTRTLVTPPHELVAETPATPAPVAALALTDDSGAAATDTEAASSAPSRKEKSRA